LEQNSLLTHIRNGDRLILEGHFDEAQREYSEVLAVDPTNFWASNMLGSIYFTQGHYQDALSMYLSAVRMQPDAMIYERLGDIYRKIGDFYLAEVQYQLAQKLKPDYLPAWEKWYEVAGDWAQSNGQMESAVENYRKAIALSKCTEPPQQPLAQRYLPAGWPVLRKLPVINNSDWISSCLSR
jgi:tetratricopeptide (TPR) repeat protein